MTGRCWLRVVSTGLSLAMWVLLAPRAEAQKTETWIEVRTPNFTILSNAGEKPARRVAEQFETFRAVLQSNLSKFKLDPGQPVIILAAKDEKSLKRLLPEYWEIKGHMHPAGVFQPGPEKHYAALRVDVYGEQPYQVIYHEYVHLLVEVNYGQLPLWLNEGLAEFYANAVFTGTQAIGLGRPSEYHLALLNQNRLLPIETLLTADHSSPHYNEANHASIFYAQSWALTHYLMLGDRMAHTKQLQQYLQLLHEDMAERPAAERAFGDLKKFEKILREYVGYQRFFYIPVKPPQDIDEKQFPLRQLSPAESAAVLGDFFVHTRRSAEAHAALEQAIALDPTLAAPRESLGILAFHEGQPEQARRWFAEAVELDSKSFLAHYFHAMLSFQGQVAPERLESAEAELRRAIELRPSFAPAHAVLAQICSMSEERLPEALEHARRASQLDPGTMMNHIALANVLLRMGKTEDARLLGQRVLAAAKNPGDRQAAQSFLGTVDTFQTYLLEKKRDEEERKQYQEELKKEAAEREEREKAVRESKPAANTAPAAPAAPFKGSTAPGEGVITSITCQGAKLDLTLTYYGLDMNLHSENFWKVEYLTTHWKPPENFNPCQHLKGRNVQVEYYAVTGKPYAGELVSVEVRK